MNWSSKLGDFLNIPNGIPYLSFFSSMKKIGFEEMKSIIEFMESSPSISTLNLFSSPIYEKENSRNKILIINTLPYNEQDCLIPYTLPFSEEETTINNIIENGIDSNIKIIIYGRNCNDEKMEKKYKQLISFGFQEVYVYTGGLFEWVLLQDIYGIKEFPTTTVVLDILRFSSKKNV